MSQTADEAPRRRERAADVVDLPPSSDKASKERKPQPPKEPKQESSNERKPESSGSRQNRNRRRPRRKPQRPAKPSVERVMLVSGEGGLTQIAVLEEGQIVEHYVTRPEDRSIVGNVYLGKVQNVLPGMEASFIDVGESRNGVLYAGEVGIADDEGDEVPRIETVLKSGQAILVQVTKDPMRSKGARLTALVSLAGRHLVLVPRARSLGVSRRLPDRERSRLRDIAQEILPEEHGLIVRTAAEGASRSDLEKDLKRVLDVWEEIEKGSSKAKAPALIYSEPGLEHRVIRDVFNRDVSRCVIADADLEKKLRAYIRETTPDLDHRLEGYSGKLPIFEEYRVVEQIRKSLDRKVWLPSGGHLVIDRTEAMTVIDVNTGKFVGKSTLEETVFRTNKEAAVEVGRQLRLRDIGGIIVIDFIDMEIAENRNEVFKLFRGELDKDRTRTQVFEISPLGLVQMTRKNVSAGIVEAFSDPCPTCEGRGILIHDVD
ncbi:MAG: ribonuclease [Actinomycetota bacterium]|nr:ribonuclease [Actinomycetota bacterium]